jgi:hypothetical protein
MKFWSRVLASVLVACWVCATPTFATDVDGPDDCQRAHEDFGDAPECIPAYPSGLVGLFPTCLLACPPISTQTGPCPPISTPPGPTGFVRHIQPLGGYWLGCYPALGIVGIDNEPDGKTNFGGVGTSACAPIPTDCVEPAFGMFFDQDECYLDGSDAGVTTPPGLTICSPATVVFTTTSCVQRQVFLNICVDYNQDGDWNDSFTCPPGCVYEWSVVNAPIVLAPGCMTLTSPFLPVGPIPGPGWMRISLTDAPVPPDYPWNGSAGVPDQSFQGGETEDYPVTIGDVTRTDSPTWGRVKTLYR